MKVERVYQTRYRTIEEAKIDLFDYIETWYNKKRLHSAIGMKSIQEFEEMNKDDYIRDVA